MKLVYSFRSVKDLSDLLIGEQFLDILQSNGLIIDKAGNCEPLRIPFLMDNFPNMWKGRGVDEHTVSSCYFLFRGNKKIKFSGMVLWDIRLHPSCEAVNSVTFWLDIPKTYDVSKLVKMGDDIFKWCEAIYGYITERSKETESITTGGIQNGISGLMWANYFGKPYIDELDFRLPANHKPIGHGVKIILTETPFDEKLIDSNYIEPIKKEIGFEWFWHQPLECKIKVPYFDRSEISQG